MCNVCRWHPEPKAFTAALETVERGMSALERRLTALGKQGATPALPLPYVQKRSRSTLTRGLSRSPCPSLPRHSRTG